MRLLLIEEDAERCEQIRQRLVTWRPRAELVVHDPVTRGALEPEFLAQGFDAVLLADKWRGGSGVAWARELAGRPGFAPLVLLSRTADAALARDAAAIGAWSVCGDDLEHEAFAQVLAAVERHQVHARAVWRTSEAGREAQRFGDAFIRDYRRIRRLSSHATTDLYVAESERAGSLVVLKVARDAQEDAAALDPFARFLQEFEIAQRIASPEVVRLYDLGVSDEHAWLVMEYFRLGDLRRRMHSGLAPREALQFAVAIARALSTIHAAGVLHRDLKPGNVLLRDDGGIALIDFGLSKDAALALDVTDAGTIFGTPHYMSPEQGHAEPIDARSDLYSLGVVYYEMLTGRKPYTGASAMEVIYKHKRAELPKIAPEFAIYDALLQRLLAKSPADRFQSAHELLQSIAGLKAPAC